jgi:phosphoglycolate phosphatase
MSKEDAVIATAKYRERYKDIGLWENEPMEGVLEGLKALKEAGYVLAMSTSKPKIFADQIAEKFGFSPYFSVQVGCGLDGSFPTKASVIAETMRQLSASKEECLMVGDRFHDADGAKENGVDCALLEIGYAEDGEIKEAKPEYVFADFTALTTFLTK